MGRPEEIAAAALFLASDDSSSPAPYESVTTRTEDGPIYSPNGKEMAFVMDDLLYTEPVDGDGRPTGLAVQLNEEATDAPTYSADSSKILYLNEGNLKLIDRSTKAISTVPVDLTFTNAKLEQKLLIHAARFGKDPARTNRKTSTPQLRTTGLPASRPTAPHHLPE
jgi:hypothetical protein